MATETLRGLGTVANSERRRKLQLLALNSSSVQVFAGTRKTPKALAGLVQSKVTSRRPLSGTEKSKWYKVLPFTGPASESTVVCLQVSICVQFGGVPVVPAGQSCG